MSRPRKRLDSDENLVGRPDTAAAIADARRARKWSQETLAKKIGRQQQTIAGWEKTRGVPADAWLKLCTTLDLPLTLFLGEGSEPIHDAYIEAAIAARQQRLFRRLFNELRDAATEFGHHPQEDDFAFLVHTLWTRALLLEVPTALEERVNLVIDRQRQAWNRERDEED